MGIADILSKHEKLKVLAYEKPEREGKPVDEFEVMFNPSSITESYSITWSTRGKWGRYHRSEPSDLDLDLVLDGTGVSEMGILVPDQPSVEERVKKFKAVAYDVNGDIHQPNYLVVKWGVVHFKCRLSSLDVTYTTFDRGGAPLRAELTVSFMADGDPEEKARKFPLLSPDLTHSRTVRAGDTLPLMTRAVYGSARRYLDVARYNRLDDFRRLEPGRSIEFPPLDQLPHEGPPR